jgi:virulence factor
MSERFKMAFIGAGSRANQVHYPSFASLPDVEIVGVCDIDGARLQTTCDKYEILEDKRYTGSIFAYREMLEEVKPDGVAVIGQPHLMYDIWMECLDRGLNLYVEKPLGLNRHQARMLAEKAHRKGVTTTCTLQRRTTPCAIRLREECLKHGPIDHALVRFYKCALEDFMGARDHMMDDTIHSIDCLCWALGDLPVVNIESMTRRIGTPDINYISATLTFAGGAMGYLINSWVSGRRVFDLEMHARGVCAEVEHETGGTLYENGDTKGIWYDAAHCAGSEDFHVLTGVKMLARDFVDACREKRASVSSFDSALKSMEIAEIILAQAALAGH